MCYHQCDDIIKDKFMLRKLRIILAVISFIAITLLFLDFTGVAQQWWGWMAKIQFVPALMALNIVVVVLLVVLTLILGRIYCSVICPLGVMQDIVTKVRGWFGKKAKRKNRFKYTRPKTWLRLTVLALFVVLIAVGLMPIASLVEPYSEYGRIVSSLIAPVYDVSNNLMADAAESMDSYMFYHVETYENWWLAGIAIITLFIVGVMAWIGGRAYCNSICPVGTILGTLSRYSWLKPVIDTSKCNGCTKCARNCKASCIDAKNHEIDYSRCVACMDCIENCSTGAISYTMCRPKNRINVEKKVDDSRRNFLTVGAVVATATMAKAADKTIDGGLTPIIDKKIPQRATRIVPPGAVSIAHLERHCTSCQLCITACPNGVLRPSTDLSTFMQPVVEYEHGYCRPECVRCSEVCPAGVFHPITVAEKSAIQIGHAVVRLDACIVASEGKRCGNCAHHCPAEAIKMVPMNPDDEKSNWMPVVNEEKCIGCGECEYLCPVRPLSAIYVEGHEVHRKI